MLPGKPAELLPDLQELHFLDPQVRDAVGSGKRHEGVLMASETAAASLNDLAVAWVAQGKTDEGLQLLRQALRIDPASRWVFHNLTTLLLGLRRLRGDELTAIQQHLLSRLTEERWTRAYGRLLLLPHFLNLAFVSGRCNLQCRMCLGGSGDPAGRKFSYMSVEDFRKLLEAAPSIQSLVLSSGNSEPLLHPEFEQIVDIAKEHGIVFDIFTNGLPLSARVCRKMVTSKAVHMVNFSIDAATEETYRRIRGAEFDRVIKKLEMLREMKAEANAEVPLLSLSFVAMADNIAELPDFVDLAARFNARRVYVEDLIGWEGADGPNRPATENPGCADFVAEAGRRAAAAGIPLKMPERLRREPVTRPADEVSTPIAPPVDDQPGQPTRPTPTLHRCGWINGVWVEQDGRLDPCCMVHGVADLGTVRDGSLLTNEKYIRVKSLLYEGRVFPQCAGQRMCQYVQQQEAAGIPLRFISEQDLGRLAPAKESSPPAEPEPSALAAR